MTINNNQIVRNAEDKDIMELPFDKLTAPGSPNDDPVAAVVRPDHERVDALFSAHDKQQRPSRKKQFIAVRRVQLSALALAEEEVFYHALSAGTAGR